MYKNGISLDIKCMKTGDQILYGFINLELRLRSRERRSWKDDFEVVTGIKLIIP
jgi:hypothetical protein